MTKLKFLKSFTISRKKWLRGDPNTASLLDPKTGKQCCLGIYLLACGVPKDAIYAVLMPDAVSKTYRLPKWLRTQSGTSTVLARDNDSLNEPTREQLITQGFATKGIKVRFVP